MLMIPSGVKRTRFLKKRNIYGALGNNVMIQSRKIPLYPELIYVGDNVRIASDVKFITHDVIHNVLNNLPAEQRNGHKFVEKCGKIEIGDNVFIGAGTILTYDTKIGSNVVIGTGSVVVKDIPDDSVCAGVPCKRIGSFQDFLKKRMKGC